MIKTFRLFGRILQFGVENRFKTDLFDKENWHFRIFDLALYGARCPPNLDYDTYYRSGKNVKYITEYGIGIIFLNIAFSIEYYSKPKLGEKCSYCGNREYLLWNKHDEMCYACFSFADKKLREELKRKRGGK